MKRRILPLILATVLALFSVPFATTANTTAPTVYASLNFDDLTAGDAFIRDDKIIANLDDGTMNVVSRAGSNNCIKWEKTAGSNTNSQFTVMPYYAQHVLGTNHNMQEVVISWDMYIHGNDGRDFVILSARTYNGSAWKWGPDINLTAPDGSGVGTVVSNDNAGTVTDKGKVTYDQWNTFTLVWKPDTSATRTADKVDLYINGELAVQDHKMVGYKIRQLAIGNFAKGTAIDTCYWMKDNLRIYSGSKVCTDEELGLSAGADIVTAQTSNKTGDNFNLRVISTIDSTKYEKAGFDIQAAYGSTTVSATKEISSVYSSILANTTAGIATYTAGDLGGKYLAALTINGVPTNVGKVEITVSAWTIAKDGTKIVNSVVCFTYDGTNSAEPISVTAKNLY